MSQEMKPPQGMNIEQMKQAQIQKEEEKKQIEEQKSLILKSLLSNEARERLNRISLVKPEKARQLEIMIIQMGQTGRLSKQLSERELIDMLEQIEGDSKPSGGIKFRRKGGLDDSDDDIDDLINV